MRRPPEHARHRHGRLSGGRPVRTTARLLVVPLVVAAGGACSSDEPSSPRPSPRVVEIDGAMPSIEATTLDGEPFATADLAGTPTVVNFWATWCDPCEREQPILVRAHEAADGRVAFLGVDFRDQDGAARRWLSRYGVGYPNVADPSGSLASRFGVTVGLPTTILVDAQGRMRYRVFGELDARTLDDLLERITERA